MADPKIKFKRSAVAGKIPTAVQVPLGEIALNTNDGILYASKDVGAGTTVIAINPFRVGVGTNNYNAFFTAGNVGIGSTIPTSKLTVSGDTQISGVITATTFSGSGASLTNLNASNLASGTIPDARFPAALPAIDGSALTGITAEGLNAIGGLTIKNQSGNVAGTAGSVSTIDFNGSTGVTVTATTGAAGIATVVILAEVVSDTTPQLGGDLDLNGNNITGSGDIPAANLTGTLPAISGANLTNLNGSNISSGTVSAARVGALPASKITTGTFDAARIPTLNQDTTGTAALAEGLTGSPTIGVSTITTTGSVGIGSTLPTGKLDVIGQVNIKSKSTTTTSGIATSYTGSVYLDGNSDYLTVPGPGTLAASSNWTLECYFYCTGTSSGTYRIVGANESVNGSQYSFIRIRNGQYQFFTDNAYSSEVGTATFNAWHHIAFTKTGTTLRGFVDGVKIYEATDNNSDTITTLVVGWGYGSEYFPGYISNVRFVNGTSLYKSNFTPQTAELTKIYNTTHLLAQSSSSATAEATGKTVTAVGTAAASTTNPSLVKGFSTSGSVQFDGADDYLTFSGSSDFSFGTGDFTVEWYMLSDDKTANGVYNRIFCNDGPTGDSDGNLQFNIDEPSGALTIWKGTSPNVLLGTKNLCDNKWHHVAVTRSGTTLRIFVDGVQDGSVTNSTNWGTHNSGAPRLHIGSQNGTGDYDGYLSNFRILKGTALYTSDFSPTYTELTNLPNTKLLALQSSSSATAYTVSPGAITAQGNAAASSTSPGLISPNSLTGSVEFDGNGDYLTVTDSSLNPGTGDFAIEAFIKFASNTGTRRAICMDTGTFGSNSLVIRQYDDGWEFYCGGQNHYSSGYDMTKWQHALVTRSSNTIRYIIDGKLIGTDTSSNNIYAEPSNQLTIGGFYTSGSGEYTEGFISNVRLVVGSVPSEYETTSTTVGTQIFTPTREELTNVTDTKFLGLQSASSATAYAVSPASISVYGDASASSTSPGLVKAYTNATGQTTTTTTTSGNLLVSGITTATNRIDIKSDDSTPGRIDFYCESSNAHYTQLRSAAHSAYSGIATVTLPTSTGTLLLTDGSGASLTNLPAANLTGTLPAISGANLTNLNGSNISSGTVAAARVGALPASKITTGTFDAARIPTLNQDTTGTAALAEGLTGSPSISVTNITASGNVSIAGTLTYEDVTNIDSVGIVTARSGISIPDSQKIQLGDSNDLQIYHDGSNSYVKDAGTGALHLLSGNTAIKNAAENKTSAVFNVATSVDLYHNNSKKFETTSTGAKITGDLVVTGEVIPSTSAPGVTTTTSTSQTALDTFSHSTYTSAVYNVQATSGSNVHLTTINVIHDGSDTYLTEFATLKTGSSLATYTTDISGSNLRLLATPASTNATIFSVSRTLIRTSDSDTVTTTSTSATTINQFATTNSSAIYVVQAKQGSNVHTTKIHLVHDGSTVSMTEFAIVKTGSSLASYDADISGSNVRLRATSASSSSTTYTISRNLL